METEDLKEELTNFNGNGHDRAKNSLTNFFSLIILTIYFEIKKVILEEKNTHA
ncbi:hypothetical protein LCGC14_2849690 [marine sediment metagenome]|uniref:Uncharacterized protein n=1 Tax=marine sediment metagenome TaxID=412755 RepID=A0A0F8YVH5_9ZZZZ